MTKKHPRQTEVLSDFAYDQVGSCHFMTSSGSRSSLTHSIASSMPSQVAGSPLPFFAICSVAFSASLRLLCTLGAKNFPLDENGNPIKGIPRHPIVEDDVIIYSNATLLGRITIGKGAVIGANVWVTHDVEPKAKVLERKL